MAVLLINSSADVNAMSNYGGWTPLQLAASRGHKGVAALLIIHAADVNAKMGDNWTPLHQAVANGHREVAALLINSSADVDAKTKHDGWTPLHQAAWYGNKGLAELLLSNSADVTAKDNDGKTAIMIAEERGDQDIAELLRLNQFLPLIDFFLIFF